MRRTPMRQRAQHVLAKAAVAVVVERVQSVARAAGAVVFAADHSAAALAEASTRLPSRRSAPAE